MKLRKCILLLPTSFNGGAEVPPAVLAGVLRTIDEAFDSYTVDGLCDGVYAMKDGTRARDKNLKVWFAVAPERVTDVRELAAKIARVLKQESLYFEVTEAEIEFVPPALTGDVR